VIVCPLCGSVLAEEKERFSCPSCPYCAEREQDIVLFSPEIADNHEDYKAEGLDALYVHETQHPWFRHRVNVIRKAFATHVGKTEDILEVGAGTGHTARALLEDGYRNLSIGELHKNGLLYAKRYGLERLYQFDLRASPFREHFDVVALFDVLEHIADDELALNNIHKMLRPGGRVILTVPAHQALWSRIDELSSHHRRYNRRGLASLLQSGGFEILQSRYFFTALVPGLLARRFVSRNATWETVESGIGLKVSRLANLAMRLASGPGDFLLAPLRRFVGGSLLTIARKV
jgi:2-polyprenyl-3-methyl-5-hydroxy-6-metoxy-1,4-benzoquinol methylase